MGIGFEKAVEEITLVLFTTLAPAGTLACIILAALLLSPKMDENVRRRLNRFFCVPVLVTLIGLVASATHLGNPANALYVLSGVGRSPLSNEVFSAAVFLGLAGTHWLMSFSVETKLRRQQVWLVLVILSGFALIASVCMAYNVETILTWHSPYVALGVAVNSLVAGPLMALAVLALSQHVVAIECLGRWLVVLSAVAMAVNVGLYLLQGIELAGASNSTVSFTELVPFASLFLLVFVAFCGAAEALAVRSLHQAAVSSWAAKRPRAMLGGSCVLALAGIFVMRFVFYMAHMTVGVSF